MLQQAQLRSEPDLTARALLSGLGVGALLCVANLYMGLKTGIWDSGHVTASILAFALASGRLGRLENNVAQTAAVSAGAVPAAAGLLGAVPALALLGRSPPAWGVALWGLALALVGVGFAVALRRRLVEEERLPFPTGVATAEVIEALHAGGGAGRGRARALVSGSLLGAVLGWFRDGRPTWIPGVLPMPGSLAGAPAAALGFGISTSPLLIGVGLVVGLRVASSMLLGSLLAWGVLGSWLVRGLHVAPSQGALFAWLSWPGTALLVGAAAVAIAQQARSLGGALRDLRAVAGGGPRGRDVVLALGVCVAIVVLGSIVFDLHPIHTLLALALSVVFATVCARSAGLTDVVPLGPVGQLTQAIFGGMVPGQPALNVAAGSVPAGDATQTTVLLWSFRAGSTLRAPVRPQVLAAIAGCAVGAAVCMPAYQLLIHAYGLGSPTLPIPTGVQWKAMAEVAARGSDALPPGALPAVVCAAALGVLLAALGSTRLGRWLPSAFAVGIGMLVPVNYSAAILLGALALTAGDRLRPGFRRESGPVAGAGLIAGDSVVGLLVALLRSFALL